MSATSHDPFQAAEVFLQHSGRLLERLRFEHLYRARADDAAAEQVLSALAPYQNADGGFGQVLEPDFRGPVSQPLCTEQALRVLSELGSASPRAKTMRELSLAHLSTISAPDGGVPNVLPSVGAYPRAPWWQVDPAQPGSLLPTASIAGLLLQQQVVHPWLERASGFTWRALEAVPERLRAAKQRLPLLQALYETRAALLFLDQTPERERAERTAEMLGSVLHELGLFDAETGDAELAAPLDFATHEGSLACRWFEHSELERQLEALLRSQQADGGFTISWQVWTPLAGLEWRGIVTIERLKTLVSYGRLQVPT